jgi:hypothetical protein
MATKKSVARARLAQSVERWTFNPTAVGSSPTSGAPFVKKIKYNKYAQGGTLLMSSFL